VRGAGAAGESAREGAVRGPWELANNMSDILMREHMAPDVGNDNRNSGWDGVPSIDMNDAFEKYAFVQRKGSGRQGERRQAVARGCAGDGLDISKKGGVESKFLRENVREPAKLYETPEIAEWLVLSGRRLVKGHSPNNFNLLSNL